MRPEDGVRREEVFEGLVAAFDEALAEGCPTSDAGADRLDPDLLRRYLSAKAALRFMEQASSRAELADPMPRGEEPADPGAVEEPRPLRVGRFRIVRELGAGSFGIVLLAHDPERGRDVALKVPRPEVLVTPRVRRRFLREGRLAAGLDHPGIVPILEAGHAGPVCYIAAAYCEGPDLAAWLATRTEPVSLQTASTTVAALADAVEHAHSRGVLHRDLKPSNILLTFGADSSPSDQPEGMALPVHITDFGLARAMELRRDDATASTLVIGSPAYAPPEQIEGRVGIGDATLDVYALGAILYELLVGRPPLVGRTSWETIRLVFTVEPEPPRRLRPEIPGPLEAICLKCLEKDPGRRYTSAAALADDLRRLLVGDSTQADRPRPGPTSGDGRDAIPRVRRSSRVPWLSRSDSLGWPCGPMPGSVTTTAPRRCARRCRPERCRCRSSLSTRRADRSR